MAVMSMFDNAAIIVTALYVVTPNSNVRRSCAGAVSHDATIKILPAA